MRHRQRSRSRRPIGLVGVGGSTLGDGPSSSSGATATSAGTVPAAPVAVASAVVIPHPAAAKAGALPPAAVAGMGPTPVPRDEPIVLRKFDNEEDRGRVADVVTNHTGRAASVPSSAAIACAASPSLSRPRSDSGAMALLNLASTSLSPVAAALPPSQASERQQEAWHHHQQGQRGEQRDGERDNDRLDLDLGWARTPFRHAADYAAGMALRDLVLGPVLCESRALDGSEESKERRIERERLAEDAMDDFVSGRLFVEEVVDGPAPSAPPSASSSSSGVAAAEKVVLRPAVIRPVVPSDAPHVKSWYETGGDKVLPYTTPEWNAWWVERCMSVENGCSMVKLCLVKDQSEQRDRQEEEEVILCLAYYERNVVDEFPVFDDIEDDNDDECEGAKAPDRTSTDDAAAAAVAKAESAAEGAAQGMAGEEGQRQQVEEDRQRRQQNGEKEENSEQHRQEKPRSRSCSRRRRTVRTTLLRGLRLNPSINPEVIRRSLSLPHQGDAIYSGDGGRNDDGSSFDARRYRGVQAALLIHAVAQSLSFGTVSFGVNSVKHDGAEEFYASLLAGGGRPVCVRTDDGRRYYRATDGERWELLRACLRWQLRLRSEKTARTTIGETSKAEAESVKNDAAEDDVGEDNMEVDGDTINKPPARANGASEPPNRFKRDAPDPDDDGGEHRAANGTGEGPPPSKRLRSDIEEGGALHQQQCPGRTSDGGAAEVPSSDADGVDNGVNGGHLSEADAETDAKSGKDGGVNAQRQEGGVKETGEEGKERENTSPSSVGGSSSSPKATVPVLV